MRCRHYHSPTQLCQGGPEAGVCTWDFCTQGLVVALLHCHQQDVISLSLFFTAQAVPGYVSLVCKFVLDLEDT